MNAGSPAERHTHRLAAAIVLACVTWGVFLMGSSRLFSGDVPASHRPEPLQMRLIELPPTAPRAPSARPVESQEPHRRNVVPKPAPARTAPASVRPAQTLKQTPPSHYALPSQESEPFAPTAPSHASADDARAASMPDPAPPAAMSNAIGNAQARLISQPLPTLPDDLREQGYQLVAIARFLVHPDGTFDIDLVKATPNPRLNQLLLQALRRWRFSPAMENGHPVASRQDVRVHFNVN